jgi:DNA-binding HxlR family transcriptional regulator
MRVVGEVLGNSEQSITDTLISYRLRKLVQDGRVEVVKSGSSLRDFTVKIAA